MRLTLLLLKGHPTRIALAVVSIALAIAVSCAIGTIERSVVRAFATVVEDIAGRVTLVVTAPGQRLFPQLLVHRISSSPGIDTTVPVRVETVSERSGGEPVTIYAFDFLRERYLRVYDREGAMPSWSELDEWIEAGDSIFVSDTFAARRGLHVGDTLALDTPRGPQSFTVRRIVTLDGLGRAFGSNLAIMDPTTAAAVFGSPEQVNRIDVVVRIDEDVDRVRAAITKALPDLEVGIPLARSVDLGRVVHSFQMLLWSVAVLATVLCALVAYHALATHFEGQMRQAAVMRALGMRTHRAWWELMKESLVLGAAGTVLGLPLGVALGYVLLPAVASAAALSHRLPVAPSALIVTPWTLGLATTIGFVTAALTALVPSWHATHAPILDALRQRNLDPVGGGGPSRWLRIGVATALVLTLVAGRTVEGPALGFVVTALVAVLTALIARPLLEWLAPALAERLAGRTRYFPGANLLDHTRRTALALAVLGVGIGCVVWLRVVAMSFERTLIDALGETMRAEFIVASPRNVGGWVPAAIDRGIIDRLRSLPQVQGVAANRITDTPFRGATVAINAFDPDYFADVAFGRPHLVGAHAPDIWRQLAEGRGVVASTNLLLNFRLRVGDLLRLETPSGPVELPIVGATLAFVSPSGTIEMSRALYGRLWNDTQLNRVWVRTRSGTELEAVRTVIARAVGGAYGVQVFTGGEMLDHLAGQARRAFAPVVVVEGIVLVVVLIGIGDALASSVLRRTRPIGIMRAVGLRRRDVAWMVVAEGCILAALGLLLGLIAGFALGALWVYVTLPALLGWMVELYAPWQRLALVVAATALVAVVAALVPARTAARLEAADALRYE